MANPCHFGTYSKSFSFLGPICTEIWHSKVGWFLEGGVGPKNCSALQSPNHGGGPWNHCDTVAIWWDCSSWWWIVRPNYFPTLKHHHSILSILPNFRQIEHISVLSLAFLKWLFEDKYLQTKDWFKLSLLFVLNTPKPLYTLIKTKSKRHNCWNYAKSSWIWGNIMVQWSQDRQWPQ